MSAWVLEARDLRMTYGSTRAVDGVSLTVGPGQAFGLVGPDGAGKTTTMRLLVGLLAAGTGEVTILGQDCAAPGRARWRMSATWRSASLCTRN